MSTLLQVQLCTLLNLTCISYGGAASGENAMMHIGAKARMVFMNNIAYLLCIFVDSTHEYQCYIDVVW